MRDESVLFTFYGPMGVRVEIGQSLIALIGIFVLMSLGANPVYAVMFPVALILAIFLHELGHAWGNVIQGIPVSRIRLHAGGGFCESAGSTTPEQREFVVAMGPIVNAVLWAVCGLAYHWIWAKWDASGHTPGVIGSQAVYFLWLFSYINFFLFIFNLLPVQPLDGGKLFHLIMLRFTDAQAAQSIAGAVGLAVSVVWIPAMILMFFYQGWILFFIPSIIAHYRMMRGELVL